MSQSLSGVYLHLVFSTKDRYPWFQEAVDRTELHKWIGGTSKGLDCPPIATGGVEDHIHLLARFARTIDLAEWVKELKRSSNAWVRKRHKSYKGFEWQKGYAVFSVSASQLDKVEQYILNQEEHHRRVSFQDELRILLRKHRLEFDERYLWE